MKRYIFAVGVLLMPLFCVNADELSDAKAGVAIPDFVRAQNDIEQIMFDELKALEEAVLEIDPGVVNAVQGQAAFKQMHIYRKVLSRYVADGYFDAFIEQMYTLSKNTGRAIKTYDDSGNIISAGVIDKNASQYYWLDRGELDTAKCLLEGGWHKCPYPADYEEHSLLFNVYPDEYGVNLSTVVIRDGQKQHIDYELFYRGDSYAASVELVQFVSSNVDWLRQENEANNLAVQNYNFRKMSKSEQKKRRKQCEMGGGLFGLD